jgi:hypothetical protein
MAFILNNFYLLEHSNNVNDLELFPSQGTFYEYPKRIYDCDTESKNESNDLCNLFQILMVTDFLKGNLDNKW